MGRSRGGLTTKIHALVDGGVRPVALLLSPGQAGDNPRLVPLLDSLAAAGRFKQWRGIAARYDKYARTYFGGVLRAAVVIHARLGEGDTLSKVLAAMCLLSVVAAIVLLRIPKPVEEPFPAGLGRSVPRCGTVTDPAPADATISPWTRTSRSTAAS